MNKEMNTKRLAVAYSEAFKRKVVEEVSLGIYSLNRAQKIYGIGGNSTIKKWINQMNPSSKHGSKKILIQQPGEAHALSELQKRNRELEKMLVEKEFEIRAFKALNEEYAKYIDPETKKKLSKT